VDSRRTSLLAHLCESLHAPIPEALITAAELAIDLTIADYANRLVELPRGASLPAGTLVELLDLDCFVDHL
jgi:hypothetical protein